MLKDIQYSKQNMWNKKSSCSEKCNFKYLNFKTYLEVPMRELLTILGHNGAGKSTLINILTGNTSPTSGTAKVNNIDILSDSGLTEELIGLCPQHDILWEELTATEHIEIYATLRSKLICDFRLHKSRFSKINQAKT